MPPTTVAWSLSGVSPPGDDSISSVVKGKRKDERGLQDGGEAPVMRGVPKPRLGRRQQVAVSPAISLGQAGSGGLRRLPPRPFDYPPMTPTIEVRHEFVGLCMQDEGSETDDRAIARRIRPQVRRPAAFRARATHPSPRFSMPSPSIAMQLAVATCEEIASTSASRGGRLSRGVAAEDGTRRGEHRRNDQECNPPGLR
jgi:hypothetical protein